MNNPTEKSQWLNNMKAFSTKQIIGPKGRIDIIYESLEEGKEVTNLEYYSSPQGIKKTRVKGTIKLMRLELESLLNIIEEDKDITLELNNALESLKIVLAADQSIRTCKPITI